MLMLFSTFQLGVLNVLSYVIERMGVSIRPFCAELVDYLPALWDASRDHNMLRCSILATLVFIVQVSECDNWMPLCGVTPRTGHCV